MGCKLLTFHFKSAFTEHLYHKSGDPLHDCFSTATEYSSPKYNIPAAWTETI